MIALSSAIMILIVAIVDFFCMFSGNFYFLFTVVFGKILIAIFEKMNSCVRQQQQKQQNNNNIL